LKDEFGNRMKLYYEARSRTSLIRRTPVIIRLDGKAFHTFTKGFVKPFDECMYWNDYPTKYRRGSCCVKDTISEGIAIRSSWRIDNEIPIFVEEGRNYIEKLI